MDYMSVKFTARSADLKLPVIVVKAPGTRMKKRPDLTYWFSIGGLWPIGGLLVGH